MTDAIDVGEVMRTGLRRAPSVGVLVPMALGAAGNVVVAQALHAVGFVGHEGRGHAAENIAIAEVTLFAGLLPIAFGHAWASRSILLAEEPATRREAPTIGLALRLYLGDVVLNLAIALGLAACVVPAFVVAVWLSVLLPAMVAEGLGPRRGVARSRELVRGRGAQVLAVLAMAYVVMLFAIVVCELPILLPLVARARVGDLRAFLATVRTFSTTDDPGILLAQFIARTVYGAIWMGVTNVLYLRLRRRERVSDQESLARVFE
jgi:hypothetical protein